MRKESKHHTNIKVSKSVNGYQIKVSIGEGDRKRNEKPIESTYISIKAINMAKPQSSIDDISSNIRLG